MPFDFPLGFPIGAQPTVGPKVSDADRAAFGIDLFFAEKGLLVEPKGDYSEIWGIENLRRAILRRLLTVPGTYRFFPQYGVGVQLYVKKPMTQAVLDDLQQRIADNISQDRRVARVLLVQATKTTFGNDTGLQLLVRVEALGRTVTFSPFNFLREVG